ncbi:MAG: efflux RND transporter permease subunit [Candidatus Obscuribacterales bacterium]|nr:efflux RND transporter permease subunit [Candidatus Obscuribacterales bacterium]
MLNISAWTIRQPIPSILLFIMLTIAGLVCFTQIEMDELPNIDMPTVSISIAQSGAAPSELEVQVTRKVEDALSGLSNIKHITSNISEGSSTTTVEFELGTNTDRAVNDVRDRVNRIRASLPAEITEPIIQRLDFAGEAFATYTVSSDSMSDTELSWLIDNDISRVLLSVPGVGQVQRSGGVAREVRINLDPAKLEAVGLTAESVNNQVRLRNINMPGGRGRLAGAEQTIRTVGSAHDIDELRNLKIALRNGEFAPLSSLGTVEDSHAEARQMAYLDGKPVVAFSLKRSTGRGMAQVAKMVDRKLDEMKATLPPSVKIEKVRTSAVYVQESFDATIESLVLGAVLAVVIIWVFLKDWRSAGISALAMPLSMIPTFIFIKLLGYTLNDMSLLGLALVIGILVDDAIVEVENIVRHIHMGKTPYQAALDAADEIGLAVVATTFSIIAVFVPLALISGIPGQFFRQFGFTVAIAVFMSLVVARLMTPMMAAFWLKNPPAESGRSKLVELYDVCLDWALKHRKTTLAAAFGFFLFSLGLTALIPMNLIGSVDRGETILSVELPPGKDIEGTAATVLKISKLVQANKNVERVFSAVGTPGEASSISSGGESGKVNKANLYISLKHRGERKDSQQVVEQQIREVLQNVPSIRTKFINTSGPGGRVDFCLVGSNPTELDATAQELARQMRDIKGLADVQSNASLQAPQLVIKPNRELAAEHGVTVQSIARTALVATIGDADIALGRFDLPDRQIYVRVQIDPLFKKDLEWIRNLKVSSINGALIPLSALASIDVTSGPSEITRYDKQRQVLISAQLVDKMPLGEAIEAIRALPAFKNKAASVVESPSGDVELQQDVFKGFAVAIVAAVLLMYCVLVLLFNDFVHPFTIMTSLPLSIGGAIAALMISGQPLGLYALIGIVMLMGLVAKNAILLVEYCLMSMHQGMSVDQAIRTAGDARMRPILMTTLAMVAGMVPIAMGLGAGSEVRSPMAVAVIGGLATSSLLTLIVVPVIFTIFNEWKEKLSGAAGKKEKSKQDLVQKVSLSLLLAGIALAANAYQPAIAQDLSSPAKSDQDVETLLESEYRKAEEITETLLQPLPEAAQEGISIKYPDATFLLPIGQQKLPPIKLEASYNRGITLAEALQQALSNNLPIKISNDNYKARRALFAGSLGGFLPDLSMTYRYQNVYQGGDKLFNLRTGNTSLTWAYFQGGKVVSTAFNTYYNMKAARNDYSKQVNDVLLDVYRKYNEVLYNQALLQVRIKSLETSRANLKLTKQQFRAGIGTKFAVMQSESQLASDAQNLVNQQVATRKAAIALAVVLNSDIMDNLLPKEETLGKTFLIDPAAKPVELVARARSLRPELKALEAQRRAAKAAIAQAGSALLPTAQLFVSPSNTKLSGAGGLAGLSSGLAGGATSAAGVNLSTTGTGTSSVNVGGVLGSSVTLGTSVTWNLSGLGVSDMANMEANRIIARRIQYEYNQELLKITQEVHNSFLDMQTAEEQINITEVNVNASREGLRLASKRLSLGNGTNLELIEAQRSYVNALAAQIRAFVEFRNAQAQVLRDTGTISIAALTGASASKLQ